MKQKRKHFWQHDYERAEVRRVSEAAPTIYTPEWRKAPTTASDGFSSIISLYRELARVQPGENGNARWSRFQEAVALLGNTLANANNSVLEFTAKHVTAAGAKGKLRTAS